MGQAGWPWNELTPGTLAAFAYSTVAAACEIAGAMLGMAPEDVNGDMPDAMGEVTNMIAGNLKSVLPPGVALSIPSVIEGRDYTGGLCGNFAVDRVLFWTLDETFGITLIETR